MSNKTTTKTTLPSFNLCTIVKDFTSAYMLEQFCLHYAQYNISKVSVLIHSLSKNENIERIKKGFQKHFTNVEFNLSLYHNYCIEEEGIFFTNVFNNQTPEKQWLCIADIDELIEIEKVPGEYFEKYNLIKGLLIDKIGYAFDESKSLFENYSHNFYLHGIVKTSFPYKVPFVKNEGTYLRIGSGHHAIAIDKSEAQKIRYELKYVPVHHFKWRNDTFDFLKQTSSELKSSQGSEIYKKEIEEQMKLIKNNKFLTQIQKGKLKDKTNSINGNILIHEL